VTHDQVEAMTMADRVVVMRDGRIQQVGRPADVYRRPANRFIATFVGSPPMNILEGRLVTGDGGRMFDGPGGPAMFAVPASLDIPDGPIAVGVRPEELELVAATEPGAIPATIDLVETVGADIFLSAEVAPGSSVTIRVDAESTVREGDRVNVRVAPGAARVFDEAGNAVQPPGGRG
jgi:ABC-type sugar transport system ATPase subunit